jgi:hypothetical protein
LIVIGWFAIVEADKLSEESQVYIPFVYTVHGRFVGLDPTAKSITVLAENPTKGDTVKLKFDKVGEHLFQKNRKTMRVGEPIWFDVRKIDHEAYEATSRLKQTFMIYSLVRAENGVFSIDDYLVETKKRAGLANPLDRYKLLIWILLVIVVVDVIQKNREQIVEKVESFAGKVDTILDPYRDHPEDIRESIEKLNYLDFNGKIRPISDYFQSKAIVPLQEYNFRRSNLGSIIMSIFPIVIITFVITSNIHQMDKFLWISLLPALIITIAVLVGLTLKREMTLTVNAQGIKTPYKNISKWDEIDHIFHHRHDGIDELLLKKKGESYPEVIRINNLEFPPKKICRIIEALRREHVRTISTNKKRTEDH